MNAKAVSGRLTPSDIADLASVAASTVSNWRKRHEDFPVPVGGGAGRPVFDEEAVRAWLSSRGIKVQSSLPAASLITGALDKVSQQMTSETAVLVVHQMLALRHLCEESDDGRKSFDSAETVEALTALAWLHGSEQIPPQDLVAHHVSDEGVLLVAKMVAELGSGDLVDASDAVLKRLMGGRARGGGELGLLDSRATRLLERSIGVHNHPETVFDPACGIGQLLLEAVQSHESVREVIGVEINPWAATIARIRLLLRGISAEIYTADSLDHDPVPELLADIVVIEPPVTGTQDRSYDWLRHALKHLGPDGMGFVLTRTRSLSDSRSVHERQTMIESGAIQGIIELPGKLLQHSSVALALWMLAPPTGDEQPVMFIDASVEPNPEEWVWGWLDDIYLREETEPVYSARYARIDAKELLSDKALSLLPRHWVTDADRKPAEVIARYQQALRDYSEESEEPRFALHELSRASKVCTLGELESEGRLYLVRGTVPVVTDGALPEGAIDAVEIAHMQAMQSASGGSSMRYLKENESGTTRNGDVLVATQGASAEAAVEDRGSHLLTKDAFLIRADAEHFDPYFLAMCIGAPWNLREERPGEKPLERIRQMEVPILSLEDQRAWVKQSRELDALRSHFVRLARVTQNLREAGLNLMSFGREL